MKNKQPEKLKTNIIRQNCYVRPIAVSPEPPVHDYERMYLSMTEETDADGLKHVVTETEYQITPAYVQSFAESADLRNDPMGAIVASQNAPKRENLGDIREYQRVLAMDETQRAELWKELNDSLSDDIKKQMAAQAAQEPIKEGDSDE